MSLDAKLAEIMGKRLAEFEDAKNMYSQILDVIENGDRALDFTDPTTSTTIRIIGQIASNAFDGIEAEENMIEGLLGIAEGDEEMYCEICDSLDGDCECEEE